MAYFKLNRLSILNWNVSGGGGGGGGLRETCHKTLLKVSGHVLEKKIEHESTTPIEKKLFQILLFKFLFSVILQFSIILSARLCIKVNVFKENETLKKHSVLLFTKALRSKQIRMNYRKSDITETKGIIV